MINPANPLQLLTASLDGRVKVWDFLDGILLSSFDLQLPISGMTAHASIPNTVFVLLKKYRHRDADNAPKNISEILAALDEGAPFNSIIAHFSIDLSAKANSNTPLPNFARGASLRPEAVRIGKTREAVAIGVSPNGEWLVVVGSDKVQVARTNDLASGFTRFISSHPGTQQSHKDSMTCMAFHPTDSTRLVTGDSTGRIRVWYCLQKNFMAPSKSEADDGMERHAPSTVLHWHAHAVSTLCFSPNGAHMLSGGEEVSSSFGTSVHLATPLPENTSLVSVRPSRLLQSPTAWMAGSKSTPSLSPTAASPLCLPCRSNLPAASPYQD